MCSQVTCSCLCRYVSLLDFCGEEGPAFHISLHALVGGHIYLYLSAKKAHSNSRIPAILAVHFLNGTGNGVYYYENKYFRYEGEWKNGKKHGEFFVVPLW